MERSTISTEPNDDPELRSSPVVNGIEVLPSGPVNLAPTDLPEVPDELIVEPTVTITIEAPNMSPDPVANDDLPEPIVVESQDS